MDELLVLFGSVIVLVLLAFGVRQLIERSKQADANQRVSKQAALVASMEIADLVGQLPNQQQLTFHLQYNSQKKDSTVAVLLAVLLGSVGAHRFYMGETSIGVIYLLFFWTYIPGIIGLVEAFSIKHKVELYNATVARQILTLMGVK